MLWKNSRFFTAKRKQLTKQVAAAHQKEGRVKLKDCYSEKHVTTYDTTVILEDDGNQVRYKMLFGSEKGANA